MYFQILIIWVPTNSGIKGHYSICCNSDEMLGLLRFASAWPCSTYCTWRLGLRRISGIVVRHPFQMDTRLCSVIHGCKQMCRNFSASYRWSAITNSASKRFFSEGIQTTKTVERTPVKTDVHRLIILAKPEVWHIAGLCLFFWHGLWIWLCKKAIVIDCATKHPVTLSVLRDLNFHNVLI